MYILLRKYKYTHRFTKEKKFTFFLYKILVSSRLLSSCVNNYQRGTYLLTSFYNYMHEEARHITKSYCGRVMSYFVLSLTLFN